MCGGGGVWSSGRTARLLADSAVEVGHAERGAVAARQLAVAGVDCRRHVGEQHAVQHLAAKSLEQLIDHLARRHLLRTSTIRDFMNSKNFAGP